VWARQGGRTRPEFFSVDCGGGARASEGQYGGSVVDVVSALAPEEKRRI